MRASLPTRSVEAGGLRTDQSGERVPTYLVELPSGRSVRLYEGDHIYVIDSKVPRPEIVVLALPDGRIEQLSSVDPGIEPSTGADSDDRYDLSGELLKTDANDIHGVEDGLFVLDIGSGRVLVSRRAADPDADGPFSKGDAIRVLNARLEFYDDSVLDL